MARADGAAGRHHRRLPAGAGRGRARAPCSCSTPGSARCPRPTTRASCSRTRPRCWPRSASSACRGSTSASAPASCSALMGEAGADVVGVDFRRAARRGHPPGRPGPRRCRATSTRPSSSRRGTVVAEQTRAVLAAGRAAPGHVFNLGHGVLPETDPDVLTRIVDLVHAESQAAADRRRLRVGRRPRGRGVGAAAVPRTTSSSGTPTSGAAATANGTSAPSTVRTTSAMPTNASQPPRRPDRKPRSSSSFGGVTARSGETRVTSMVARSVTSSQLGQLGLQRLQVGLAPGQLGLDLHDLADRLGPGEQRPGPGRRCAAASGPGCRRRRPGW